MGNKKQFNIDGKEIELSKEQLEDMIEDFDKPKQSWNLRKTHIISIINDSHFISIYNGNTEKGFIARNTEEDYQRNFGNISRTIAIYMDDLMETEDVLDPNIEGHYIQYNVNRMIWEVFQTQAYTNVKNFKSKEKAQIACDLLNNYKGKIFGHQLREGNE